MEIGVIGVGAVGLTLAVKLGLAGHTLHLHSWEPRQMKELRDSEVDLSGVFDLRFKFDHVHPDLSEFLSHRYDLICIAVKTPSLVGLLKKLKKMGLSDVPLMSCQNGLGTADEIAEVFGKPNALRMVINYAGNVMETTTVKVHFFHKPNFLSSVDASGFAVARRVAQALTDAELETAFIEKIKNPVYQKAILNCCLSGVCALTRMNMKDAMDDPAIVAIVKNLLLESMQVAHLEKINLGDDYFQDAMEYLSHAGKHKPSMLIDIERGLPTEIDYLNHKILTLARKHGIHLPFTDAITTLVRALDRTVRDPALMMEES